MSTYAQISSVKLILKITPTYFGINTPSSGSLQVVSAKVMNDYELPVSVHS
jgi:hypothetical protein